MLLKNKIIIAMLSVSLFGITAFFVVAFDAAETLLRSSIKNHLLSLSIEKSNSISFHIQNLVRRAESISRLGNVVETVLAANQARLNESATDIRTIIKTTDDAWIKTRGKTPVANSILINTLSRFLQKFSENDPNVGEMFVTDQWGAAVAMTNTLSDYDQSNERWWDQTVRTDIRFLEDRGYDESAGFMVIGVAVPVHYEGSIIGVLKVNFKMNAILDLVTIAPHLPDSYVFFAESHGNIVAISNKEKRKPLAAEMKQALYIGKASVTEHMYDGNETVMAFAPINMQMHRRIHGHNARNGISGEQWRLTKWFVLVAIPETHAFAILATLLTRFLFIGTVLAAIIVILGIILARQLLAPVAQLVRGVAKIGAGDLDYKIGLNTTDEIGHLANAFDNMSEKLQHSLGSLQKSETRFRTSFECSPLGMAIAHADGNVVETNPAFQQMLGYSNEEIVRMGWKPLTHPDDIDNNIVLWTEVQNGESDGYQLEKRYIHKTGKVIWGNLTVSAVRNTNGQCLSLVGLLEDITQRKQIEMEKVYEERRVALLLQLHNQKDISITALSSAAINGAVSLTHSDIGFFATTDFTDMNVQAWSSNVYDQCDLTDKCKLPLDTLDWMRAAVREKKVIVNNNISTSSAAKCPQSHIIINRFLAIPFVHRGEAVAVLCVANKNEDYDALDMKIFDLYLTGVWQVIQHRLGEEQTLALKEEAERANAAKSEFMANMSHELRTPLNVIIGAGYLIKHTKMSEKQLSKLKMIDTAAQSLLGIINDILDFSKIEADKLELEHIIFDLRAVIENATGMVALAADEKAIELLVAMHPDLPCTLIGDPLRLQQVIINLAANAIKFTAQGSVIIRVEQMTLDTEKTVLSFSVCDTGIGMTPEQMRSIFNAFEQADNSTTRQYGGTGLGLSISKRLVTLMGGEIAVTSTPGQGTIFSFTSTFDLSQPVAPKTSTTPKAQADLQVLMATNNRQAIEVFTEMLADLSLQGMVVTSGEEVLAELALSQNEMRKAYDVVVVNTAMPGMNGIETAGKIKSLSNIKRTPVLLMTTISEHTSAKALKDIYIQDVLEKPITPWGFYDAVLTACGKGHNRDDGDIAPTSSKTTNCDLSGIKVLVVEDDDVNWLIVQGILAIAGVITEWARDGQEAVAFILGAEKSYDAVLMDLQMPKLDGHKTTELIRTKLDAQALPIIAMTAHAFISEKKRCLAHGMNDYLTKPINVDTLLTVLQKWAKPTKSIAKVNNNSDMPEVAAPTTAFTQPMQPLPAHLPGIDMADAMVRMQGNIALLHKLIIVFTDSCADVVSTLSTSIDSNDTIAAKQIAHRLKGSAANISATELSALAKALESALLSDDTDAIAPLMQKLPGAIAQLCDTAKILKSASTI